MIFTYISGISTCILVIITCSTRSRARHSDESVDAIRCVAPSTAACHDTVRTEPILEEPLQRRTANFDARAVAAR